MNYVNYNFSLIFPGLQIFSKDYGRWHRFSGKDIKWRITPKYPACKSLDFTEYFDFKKFNPSLISIQVGQIDNLQVTFHLEEKNKALKRTLKSNMLSYIGPTLKIEDPRQSQVISAMIRFSQTKKAEKV